jgi:hypothetical protein
VFYAAQAQVQFGDITNAIDASALLELNSTNKGLLFSRMTSTERDAISSPANGLLIYNTTLECLQINDGTSSSPIWNCASGGRVIHSISTNGTAEVSSYSGDQNCQSISEGTLSGSLQKNVAASSVSVDLYADVTSPGTWSLYANANGVAFSGNGVFSVTGCTKITLNASGTPNADGNFVWRTSSIPYGQVSTSVAP